MGDTLRLIRERCSPEFPSSIFYAYKQQQEQRSGTSSTGWETMLAALVDAGFQIIGTWPMRTENPKALKSNRNQLASSIILVCRPRPEGASFAPFREFVSNLESELPIALDNLTYEGHIAPVDLAQAAIGPGMQVYSKYGRVERLNGAPVTVRDALVEINRVIEKYHQNEQGELDAASQFCADWLRQCGYADGAYGTAETLARAKNVVIDANPLAGLLASGGGKVRLLTMDEFGAEMPPSGSASAWEGCMRMAYHLDTSKEDGEGTFGAAQVARAMQDLDGGLDGGLDSIERLARILYDYHDRRRDSANARLFNNLVTSWGEIVERMRSLGETGQGALGL